MTTDKPNRTLLGRTKLITIGSIVAVGAAGAFAIGANIGILNAADNTDLGELSAASTVAAPPSTQVVDVFVDDPITSATTGDSETSIPTTVLDTSTTVGSVLAAGAPVTGSSAQEFAVDTAGVVAVSPTESGGIRLDRVDPAPGWTWTLAQTDPANLKVTFTDGSRTLEFIAGIAPDGTILAGVNEPIVVAVPGPAPATPPPAAQTGVPSGGAVYDDDEYEYEDESDDESDHESEDEDHEEEYEGGEDDD